ncbi:RAMP superfamily CRISPR-associated protein [Pasteurella atlantica]|uniref:RAMP superfamily CRISPR-associated protein n=2 Tax=Pasteurellaceae TaxID=712 RepID=A0ACC6HPG9_9PAST|nr:RAMP superfamily CRISPR-associated protein [Pasteurella atlantica]MDP8052786.1 RAMP superfamily CRISPR-associated protein [Pasteurella atlantica]MDP8106083.1 RAMP superfamily CRISPR-associated protein [Pasteurella atlantica]MDP8149469.1 RAMP superfamily CRISPR-associated protein [Pasteurella atlantica]
MKEFMKTHQVYLTPLTPIHIGCGEDFEPTNYVIDDGVLYHFEPSKLDLTDDDKKDLFQKIDSLKEIRIFFKDKIDLIKENYIYRTDASSIYKEWKEKISDDNNKLVIQRGSHLVLLNKPYIPGSSFKGALLTAFLDYCNGNENAHLKSKKEEKELREKYTTKRIDNDNTVNLFSGIKFGDFIPGNDKEIISKIYYELLLKKKPSKKLKNSIEKSSGHSSRLECMEGKKYRAYKSEVSVIPHFSNKDIFHYLKLAKKYYLDIFKEEMEDMDNKGWVNKSEYLEILKLLENDNIYLIRLGKTGANSKVYRGKDVAKIKNAKSKKGEKDIFNRATTYHMVAEKEDAQNNLFSLGWAILEVDPKEDNDDLIKVVDPSLIIRRTIADQEQQEQAKQQKLASLSGNFKIIAEKIEQWEKIEKLPQNSSPIVPEYRSLLELAFNQNWSNEEKQELLDIYENKESILWTNVDNFSLSGKSGKTPAAKKFKQALNILTDSLCN